MFNMIKVIANNLSMPVWGLYAIIAVIIYFFYLDFNKKYKNKLVDRDKLATSGLAELQELKSFNKKDGIQLSKNFYLSSRACYEHICIIGPTGAGKTTSVFYPNLLQSNSFCGGESSVVITDPKGELYKDTADYQKKLGRKVCVFSPLEPQYSFKYNPLEFCKNETEVIDLAGNLLIVGTKSIEIQSGKSGGSPDFINMAKPLLASALLYVWYIKNNLNTIANAIDLIINSSLQELYDLLGKSNFTEVKRQFNSFFQSAGSPKTVASIKVTLASNLQIFTDPTIRELTSRNTIDFTELRRTPIALYINYPERHAVRIAPLLSIFFHQLIDELMNDENLIENYLPVFFLFDEMGNIGKIPNLATLVSTVRSRKISFLCCLQSKNQLKSLYGNEDETILGNLKTKAIYGALQDLDTTRYVSELCGNVEIKTVAENRNENVNVANSYNYSTNKKRLFEPDEIRRLSTDKILLLVQNNKPYLDDTNVYYTQRKYTRVITETIRPYA